MARVEPYRVRLRFVMLAVVTTVLVPVAAGHALASSAQGNAPTVVTVIATRPGDRHRVTTTTTTVPTETTTPPNAMPTGGSQLIGVSVLPGDLTVSPGEIQVGLAHRSRHGRHRYRVSLPRITVVDARGNLAGWTLSVSLSESAPQSRDSVRVLLDPSDPAVVDGLAGGLERGRDAQIDRAGSAVVCRARPPGGGGTYSCGGEIEVDAEGHARQDHLVVTLLLVAR